MIPRKINAKAKKLSGYCYRCCISGGSEDELKPMHSRQVISCCAGPHTPVIIEGVLDALSTSF